MRTLIALILLLPALAPAQVLTSPQASIGAIEVSTSGWRVKFTSSTSEAFCAKELGWISGDTSPMSLRVLERLESIEASNAVVASSFVGANELVKLNGLTAAIGNRFLEAMDGLSVLLANLFGGTAPPPPAAVATPPGPLGLSLDHVTVRYYRDPLSQTCRILSVE